MTDGVGGGARDRGKVEEPTLIQSLSAIAVKVARFNNQQFEMPHLTVAEARSYLQEYHDDPLVEDWVDDDRDPAEWLPEDVANDMVTSLAAAAYGTPQPTEWRRGTPPQIEDAAAYAMFVSLVRSNDRLRTRIGAIAGADSTRSDWDAFSRLTTREYGVVIDAIDGTSAAAATGANWVVTLLLYRKTTTGWDVRAVITAGPTGRVQVGSKRARSVQISHGDDRIDLLSATADPVAGRWSVAVVAAHGYARERVAPLFVTDGTRWGLPDLSLPGRHIHRPALSVYTVGGATVLAQMPTSSLGFAVIPTWSTLHDAAPLVALALLEDSFEFIRFDKVEELTPREVLRLFNDVHRPPAVTEDVSGPGTYRPIPPMVVSRRGGGGLAVSRPGDGGEPGDRVVDRIVRALHECHRSPLGLHTVAPLD